MEVAHDGREGLRRVCERRPDVILTDLMMPFASGVDLAAAIRERSETRNVPIVLMSAVDTPPARATELCNAFLRKPFDLHKLLDAIRNFAPP